VDRASGASTEAAGSGSMVSRCNPGRAATEESLPLTARTKVSIVRRLRKKSAKEKNRGPVKILLRPAGPRSGLGRSPQPRGQHSQPPSRPSPSGEVLAYGRAGRAGFGRIEPRSQPESESLSVAHRRRPVRAILHLPRPQDPGARDLKRFMFSWRRP
jgi:hypothetical protein